MASSPDTEETRRFWVTPLEETLDELTVPTTTVGKIAKTPVSLTRFRNQ
jgi:hypothetical protein